MKRRNVIVILFIIGLLSLVEAPASLFAQNGTPLGAAERQKVEAELTQAAVSMQSLQCRFVQEKTSSMLAEPTVAEGLMQYTAPDKLRWEYTSPYAFALVVDGEHIVKEVDGKAEVIDSKSNRMYQGIVNIIMGSASGKKLFDASVFDTELYDEGEQWCAVMTPKRRDMKRMFSQLVFHFDKKSRGIKCVEFKESAGDTTVIRFEEMKVKN